MTSSDCMPVDVHRQHLLEPGAEREHLEAAGIGERRARPVHERAESAAPARRCPRRAAGTGGRRWPAPPAPAGRPSIPGSTDLTVALVPTAMNAGVWMTPCGVVITPVRPSAPGSLAPTSNPNPAGRAPHRRRWLRPPSMRREARSTLWVSSTRGVSPAQSNQAGRRACASVLRSGISGDRAHSYGHPEERTARCPVPIRPRCIPRPGSRQPPAIEGASARPRAFAFSPCWWALPSSPAGPPTAARLSQDRRRHNLSEDVQRPRAVVASRRRLWRRARIPRTREQHRLRNTQYVMTYEHQDLGVISRRGGTGVRAHQPCGRVMVDLRRHDSREASVYRTSRSPR